MHKKDYSNFPTSTIFSEELEPKFVIHNISITTAVDVTYFSDDVNIYPVFYPGQLQFGDAALIGKKRQLFQTIFFIIFVGCFGNSPVATECT